MRLLAIFPLICSLGSLILTLLILFAGTSPSFLPNADLLTLNSSRLGHTDLFNTSDNSGGFFGNIANHIEGDINNLINNITSDIADALNLHDFYSAHIMNYCEGSYEYSNGTATGPAAENITHCSSRSAFFHFDPTKIVQTELVPGISLTDLHWPSSLTSAIHDVETASKAMFILYLLAIIFSGLALLTSAWGLFTSTSSSSSNHLPSLLTNILTCTLALLSIGIASAIATAIIVKVVDDINKYGGDIGLAAYRGNEFMGLTWTATALMLLACAAWVAEGWTSRRRGRRGLRKQRG